MSVTIDTEVMSARMRGKAIRRESRQILVTNFHGTLQERDLSAPANCNGFGRIRHFRREGKGFWPQNPLPIDPASKRLGLAAGAQLNAQVFQNAACNWRCWYCFVPFDLLNANEKYAGWLTANELVEMFVAEGKPARMIDLTGGQPELTPEWVPWMMEALDANGLSNEVFLWSDDNLSNDYFWRFLTESEIKRICQYPMYSKVCCFKGFDAESFAFNTKAHPNLFAQQFDLFGRYMALGIDLYAYVTFTGPSAVDINAKMNRFVDQLQQIHPNLPLRTVPLEVFPFSVVEERGFTQQEVAFSTQAAAIDAWLSELTKRFSVEQRNLSIADVPLGRKR